MVKQSGQNRAAKAASAVLATIFGLIVFHAPLTVFFGRFAHPLLVKSWKEIILLLLLPLVIYIVWRSGKFIHFSRNILLNLILVYTLLHLVFLFVFDTNLNQKLAGLAIDLRYMLFFGLVFCLVRLQPSLRRLFLRVGVVSGSLSVGFAVLQALVLPPDILKYLGYSKNTIAPYLTVDQNNNFIRINGTLRGPNPLGAYMMILLSLLTVFAACSRAFFLKYKTNIAVALAAMFVVLWASYSRSAFLGVLISLGVIFFILKWQLHFRHWVIVGGILLAAVTTVFIMRDSYFVQNVIIHSNPSDSEHFNSNQGHAISLQESLVRTLQQPLGEGIGSTGSASLLGARPLIIENQYLFIAHEVGWIGLAVFMAVLFIILKRLYANRADWLNLGVFASGVGLAIIGLIQPVFVDDTVSLVWWGLAAIALAAPMLKKAHRG